MLRLASRKKVSLGSSLSGKHWNFSISMDLFYLKLDTGIVEAASWPIVSDVQLQCESSCSQED